MNLHDVYLAKKWFARQMIIRGTTATNAKLAANYHQRIWLNSPKEVRTRRLRTWYEITLETFDDLPNDLKMDFKNAYK